MIYILNTNLNEKKKVKKALPTIYGIGSSLSIEICDQLGISDDLNLKQLNSSQIEQLSALIQQNYLIGAELHGRIRKNKDRLKLLSTYRGIRHTQGLPCRGQRSHGNARTVRKLSPSYTSGIIIQKKGQKRANKGKKK